MNTKEITIRQNAKRIRAEILCDAIDIEDILTRALGDLYTKSVSADRLIHDLIIDLTFAKKINLFSKFVKEYPQFFAMGPTIIRDLNEVREKRNIIAHRVLSVPWFWEKDEFEEDDNDYVNNEIKEWETKCEFKKSDTVTSFTLTDLESFRHFCSKLYFDIHTGVVSILDSLPKKEIGFDLPTSD